MAILLATVMLVAGTDPSCSISPTAIEQRLSSESPAVVLPSLWDGAECERLLFEGLSSGRPEWLSLAVALKPHVDAWYSESLKDSLGSAMQVAPSRVLPLVGSVFDEEICLPWMMDDSGDSDEAYRQIVRNARPMFTAFLETSFRRQAQQCLLQVEQAEKSPLFGSGAEF